MEIRIYTQDMRFQGIVENQTSIRWRRKYNDVGEFEIHVPITSDNVRLFKRTNLVWIEGAKEAGVIESLRLDENNKKSTIKVNGRFLESYMSRRIINTLWNFTGTADQAMIDAFGKISMPIPLVKIDGGTATLDEITFQTQYQSLLSVEMKLAKSENLGFRFRPDFTAREIHFETYEGLDRSRSQHERSFAEFSDDFDNLNNSTYNVNDQNLKNVAYVIGKDANEQEVLIMVGDTESTGYDRRELYVDASSISPSDITHEEWLAALQQEGINQLNQNLLNESLECVIIPLGNFRYKIDYDLGDVVTVKKSNWDIGQELRITEIEEIYEHGAMQVSPTLGTPLPTTLDMEG